MGTRHCEPSTTRESLPAPVGADTPTRHNIDLNLNSGLGRDNLCAGAELERP